PQRSMSMFVDNFINRLVKLEGSKKATGKAGVRACRGGVSVGERLSIPLRPFRRAIFVLGVGVWADDQSARRVVEGPQHPGDVLQRAVHRPPEFQRLRRFTLEI